MADSLDVNSGFADLLRAPIVRTSDDAIKAPKNIIDTPAAARALYLKYRADHLKRIKIYASIEGLIAGNPPYDPYELARNGIEHIANFNTLDARSLWERGALAYWNLLNQTETLATFDIRIKDPSAPGFADTMAHHFNEVVREWKSFEVMMNMHSGQLVKLGISPLLWPDERDWRFRVVELSRFFIEDQSQSDIDQMTCVFMENRYTAQYLYEIYEQYKDKEADSPWNIQELERLLLYLANTFSKANASGLVYPDMMALQSRLQNGDTSFSQIFSDNIQLISGLYKEYDGEITHYMFHPLFDEGDFLYFVSKQYKSIYEAMVLFTASPGEFTVHSNIGLGHKIFSIAQAMNQLDCSSFDMAKLASTPFLNGMATGSKDFEQVRVIPGVPTNIGTAQFVETRFGSNIEQLVSLSQYMLNKLQTNTANSGDDPGLPDRDQQKGSKSAEEARYSSLKGYGVQKNNISHYYRNFDYVITNIVLKLLHSKPGYPGYDSAKEWKDRCLADGVPELFFKDIGDDQSKLPKWLKVRATRVAGDGSTIGRMLGLEALADLVPSFGPRELKEYKRQRISAALGNDSVQGFLQDSDDIDEQVGGASLAGVENGIIQMGLSPIFSRDNEQRAHFSTHMALAVNTIQKIQQQQLDPISADKIFGVLIPHMNDHWEVIEQNPLDESYVEQTKKAWDQVADYAKLNRNNAAKMYQAQIKEQQKQAEQTQQVLSDEELKNIKAQGDERRADYKVTNQVERAKEANVNRAEIMREKVLKDNDNEQLRIGLDHSIAEQQSLEENRADLQDINGSTPSPTDIITGG